MNFVVSKEGEILNPKIIKSVSISLDEEALRVTGKMPKWQPGVHKGEVVSVNYTIPINFAPFWLRYLIFLQKK